MRKVMLFSLAWVVCLSGGRSSAMAGVLVYAKDLAGFNAAAGTPAVAIDFDGIAPGTNITGTTIAGVTFLAPGSPLIVVRGNDTVTPGGFSGVVDASKNKLLPTSGLNVLSPGGLTLGPGPNDSIEKDDLKLVFSRPVSAFGFDHLSQSVDGYSFTSIAVYDSSNSVLYTGGIPISNLGGGGAAGGADFWGIVADSAIIKSIVVSEYDNNNGYPDCNIGYDTIRLQPSAVPEPSTLVMLAGLGGMGLVMAWRKRKRQAA